MSKIIEANYGFGKHVIWEEQEAMKDRIKDLENERAELRSELDRVKRCYEFATGEPVCGANTVVQIECKEMAKCRMMVKKMGNIIMAVSKAKCCKKTKACEDNGIYLFHPFKKQAQEIINTPAFKCVMEGG